MAEADRAAVDEPQAIERTLRFARAMVEGDAHALEELLAPGFTYTHRSARVEPREELVGSVRGGRRSARMDLEEMSVRAYGDAAVVQGVAHMRAGPADAPIVFDSRFTALWVDVEEAPRLAVYHSTGLPQE
ncbi:MAG: nuclear transport factor 2 family protein [Chloroflexi bacterium]|nr:nuclear transport factor 2 family protein [Chloroflexota bacterium]